MAKALHRTNSEISEIYNRHYKTIYGVCYIYMKSPEDTEDAVSETFIKMLKSAPAFENTEHEKAWLIRTASNVCKDILKHWWRKVENLADYSETLKTDDNLEHDDLMGAICRLPDKYKTAIHLYYYEGYNSREISQIIHKPHSTVRYYLREARNTLQKMLGGDLDEK